jgi:hypothetical protein
MLEIKPRARMTARASRISATLVALGVVATTVFGVAAPAQAYVTDGLMIYLDASKTSSYGGSGTTWTDISGNGRNGTLTGGVTFDAATQSMRFAGGANGSGFVDLDGDFKHHQLKSLGKQCRHPRRHRSAFLHPGQCSSLKVQSFQVQLDHEQAEGTEWDR